MPIINIHMISGRNDSQKRALVQSVTEAVAGALLIAPEKVKIIISEMEPNHYAIGGVLHCDQDQKKEQPILV